MFPLCHPKSRKYAVRHVCASLGVNCTVHSGVPASVVVHGAISAPTELGWQSEGGGERIGRRQEEAFQVGGEWD